jgi:uncharacterized protein YbjT (DUF2867 family)
MHIVVAGGHGQIALHVERQLAEAGHVAVGLVRNPDHVADVRATGADAIVLDLEDADVEDVARHLDGVDAVLFAAGAGPGSGAARKDTVDRAASSLLADAAEQAGVDRFVQISSMGAGTPPPPGTDETFAAYLRAKTAAEDDLRRRDLAWTVVRPGGLTNSPATGRVPLAPSVPRGQISRADVATVLTALLTTSRAIHQTLELISGTTSIDEALTQL